MSVMMIPSSWPTVAALFWSHLQVQLVTSSPNNIHVPTSDTVIPFHLVPNLRNSTVSPTVTVSLAVNIQPKTIILSTDTSCQQTCNLPPLGAVISVIDTESQPNWSILKVINVSWGKSICTCIHLSPTTSYLRIEIWPLVQDNLSYQWKCAQSSPLHVLASAFIDNHSSLSNYGSVNVDQSCVTSTSSDIPVTSSTSPSTSTSCNSSPFNFYSQFLSFPSPLPSTPPPAPNVLDSKLRRVAHRKLNNHVGMDSHHFVPLCTPPEPNGPVLDHNAPTWTRAGGGWWRPWSASPAQIVYKQF